MGSPTDKSSHGEEAAAFQANPKVLTLGTLELGELRIFRRGRKWSPLSSTCGQDWKRRLNPVFRVVLFKIEDVGCLHFCVGFCLQEGSILSG